MSLDDWDTIGTVDDLLDEAMASLDKLPKPKREHIPSSEVEIIPPEEARDLLVARADGYIEPWARLPEESDRAFELFQWYRDQGPSRTIVATAKHFGIKESSLPNRFSAPYRWRDRALAWDTYQDRLYRRSLEVAIRDMAARHAESMAQGLSVLTAPFVALQKRMDDPDFWNELSSGNVKRLIDLAVKAARVLPAMMGAERLARGLPSQITKVEGSIDHEHVHRADVDQLAAIAEALGSAGAFDDAGAALALGAGDDAPDESLHGVDPVEPG